MMLGSANSEHPRLSITVKLFSKNYNLCDHNSYQYRALRCIAWQKLRHARKTDMTYDRFNIQGRPKNGATLFYGLLL